VDECFTSHLGEPRFVWRPMIKSSTPYVA
jgi:hypothetical protein